MSSRPGKLRVALANAAWLLACLPGWLAFLAASRRVRRTQRRLMARLLRRNAATAYGREHQFAAVSSPEDFRTLPLTEYEDYLEAVSAIAAGRAEVLTSERVELLQPTSGSTAATKRIPYTRSLRREFQAAIEPWIASLYLAFPALLAGRHYWSISPSTPPPAEPAARVRTGFADDAEYLGAIQRWLARTLFAVPAELARVADREAFEYLTLLFLCREDNLRLISVWHPSFLTVLLQALPGRWTSLLRDLKSGTIDAALQLDPELRRQLSARLAPSPARARALAQIDTSAPDWPQVVWPALRVISCWSEGISEPWLTELAGYFPRAAIQGKGLTATEGIVSFPLGRSGRKACAIRSHYLEFLEPGSGRCRNAWEVEAGKVYSVVLTTGGGLYRYRLHDLVRVTGFFNQAPCLEFLARDNLVSDLVGEKLSAMHVEAALREVERSLGRRFEFALLAPVQVGPRAGYVLFVQPGAGLDTEFGSVARLLEEQLRCNYHYHHARNLSQLAPLRIFNIEKGAAASYRRHLTGRGIKAGDIKFQALSTDRQWASAFDGRYVA